MKKIKVCILGNETSNDTDLWVSSCVKRRFELEWAVVNLCAWDWFEKIQERDFDLFLTKPGGVTQRFKQLYDERLNVLYSVLGRITFPSLTEVLIYENKRYLSYWLKSNGIPHPQTSVFYNKQEALDFCKRALYPLVGKSNIGASGSGVSILWDQASAIKYIKKLFSPKGLQSRWYPDFKKGNLIPRIKRILKNKSHRNHKLKIYNSIRKDSQRDFVILQEYIDHSYEWRAVRMGDSFFAHKKLKIGDKASGSLQKNYDNPPLDLLDFVKEITDKHHLYSQAVDIFESPKGYLINEMQCFFGQSDPYQMLIDGIQGRYRFLNGMWKFEAGDFNSNETYDLRLSVAIDLFKGDLLL